jgi:hypothetical protein
MQTPTELAKLAMPIPPPAAPMEARPEAVLMRMKQKPSAGGLD